LPDHNPAKLNRGTITKVLNFLQLINKFVLYVKENEAFDAAKSIAEETGILKELYYNKSPEELSRFENIQELLNGIQEFSINAREEGQPGQLENFLEDVALLTDQDTEKEEDRNKVTLMTIHSAKGLEFKNVFVVGLEEDLFPSGQAMEKNKPEALEEERRLFYVALTRAKENAWFTYANQRYRWGNLNFCTPSRFLEEMDEKYLENPDDFLPVRKSEQTGFAASGQRRFGQPLSSFRTQHEQNIFNKKLVSLKNSEKANREFVYDSPEKIQVGMTVEHQRFGIGKVIHKEGVLPNIKVTVFFTQAGKKQLLLKFAKLRIRQ
jgi:DNA helicase-2/ATP-dependent DNA helicase PcrA